MNWEATWDVPLLIMKEYRKTPMIVPNRYKYFVLIILRNEFPCRKELMIPPPSAVTIPLKRTITGGAL